MKQHTLTDAEGPQTQSLIIPAKGTQVERDVEDCSLGLVSVFGAAKRPAASYVQQRTDDSFIMVLWAWVSLTSNFKYTRFANVPTIKTEFL